MCDFWNDLVDGEINGLCDYALSPRDAARAEELSKLNLKLGLGVSTRKRQESSIKSTQVVACPVIRQ